MKNRSDETTLKCSADYRKNSAAAENPCIVCGRDCRPDSPMLWAHYGTLSRVVSFERGEELNKTDPGSDMGCWPIGPDCLKKNPHLKPFLIGGKK